MKNLSGGAYTSVAGTLSSTNAYLTLSSTNSTFGTIAAGGTASNAYIVDIAPPKRRAEAMGLFAVTTSLGLIIGPAVGFYIVSLFDFHRLFNLATLLAVIACIISISIICF